MIGGRRYEFGVSGRLYKRNLLFYDRETDSLWSQLLSEAVTGPLAGCRLSMLPGENTTWESWRGAHPDTQVLSSMTGYTRDYNHDPYAAAPIRRVPALFVSVAGVSRIYPFSELKKAGSPLVVECGDQSLTIVFDRRRKTAKVGRARTAGVTTFVSFLDDLKAFYPGAEIYRARRP